MNFYVGAVNYDLRQRNVTERVREVRITIVPSTVYPQGRYRAAQGSIDYLCTKHALPAGAARQITIFKTNDLR